MALYPVLSFLFQIISFFESVILPKIIKMHEKVSNNVDLGLCTIIIYNNEKIFLLKEFLFMLR